MLDLLIRGGQVVTAGGAGTWDVGVEGERIVVVAAPGVLAEAAHVLDASGKLVVPGGIDPHIHAKWPIPSPGGGPPMLSGGPTQVSRAALFGGTTTLIDFAAWTPGETLQQSIERREQDWLEQCYSDYAYHVMLVGTLPPDVLDQIPEVIQAGFPSIKLFTTDITPSRRGRRVRMGDMWEVFQRTARHGGVVAVHAEDDDLVMHMYDRLAREGRTSFHHMAEVHSTLSEDLAFRRVLRLAEHVDGTAVYMVHVSAAEGVQAIAESRAKGLPVYGETLHHYASYTSADYQRPNGQIYHTYPSLKGERDCAALWEGMASGSIGSIATDGICTPLQVKLQGDRIDDVTGGNAGVEPRLGIMYSECVGRRGFSLERFVDLTSANAARVFGLYPRKGAIAVGSDADITIIDPSVDRILTRDDLHETDYSPWAGWHITGWPITTILRGKVAVDQGELLIDPSYGRRISRKVSSAILNGPAC
jgi:dihydropyrimidinase